VRAAAGIIPTHIHFQPKPCPKQFIDKLLSSHMAQVGTLNAVIPSYLLLQVINIK